jgi:hypothetical protein
MMRAAGSGFASGLLLALLAGASAGCASGGGRRPDGSASLVRAEQLPERQREVLAAWRGGEETWEGTRERVLADPELARFLVDNLVVEMVRAFDRSAIATASRPSGPFDRAQAELVRFSSHSTPVLVGLLEVKDGIVAYLAADTLGRIGAPAIEPTAAKLASRDVEVRRRAAELLGRLPHAGPGEPAVLDRLGEATRKDPSWIVRAQAARALGARGSRHEHKGFAAAALARALGDADAEVVKSAQEGLRTLGEANAIPALIQSLERAAREGDLGRLRAAQTALRGLTGETRDHDAEEWWERWKSRTPPVPPRADARGD